MALLLDKFLCICLLLLPTSIWAGKVSAVEELTRILKTINSTLVIEDAYLIGDRAQYDKSSRVMTVLTALVNIGVLPETEQVTRKDISLYLNWLKSYEHMHNPMVFVTDEKSSALKMEEYRRGKPTLIIVFKKNSSWAFGDLEPRFADIFREPIYPKLYPNTIHPAYSAVQYIKVEFMDIIARLNYFNTSYFSWMDAGHYRTIDEANPDASQPYTLHMPVDYDESKVLLSRVRYIRPGESVDHRYIMKYGPQHFAGSFWCGGEQAIKTFVSEFMRITETLLDEGLAHTDEQILATMLLGTTQFTASIEPQVYYEGNPCWTCLGQRMRIAGFHKNGEKNNFTLETLKMDILLEGS